MNKKSSGTGNSSLPKKPANIVRKDPMAKPKGSLDKK